MKRTHKVVLCLLLLPLVGCASVKREEFDSLYGRVSSLESKSNTLSSGVSRNESSIRNAQSQINSTDSRMRSLATESKAGDQTLQKAVSVEADEREKSLADVLATVRSETAKLEKTDQQLSDAIIQSKGSESRLRTIIGDLLQAEKEMLISFVEIGQVIESLEKKGTLTEADIQASKAVKLEATVWAKRLDEIKSQLDALAKTSQARGQASSR